MINEKSAGVPEVVRAAWAALDQAYTPQDPVLLRNMTIVRNWLHGDELPGSDLDQTRSESAPVPDQDRIALVNASVPVVYAWSTGTAFGDEAWVAVCEDGELMASHVSSSRAFGPLDVHTSFGRVLDRYRRKFGGLTEDHYRFVVVPEGKRPPAEVMAANEVWAGSARMPTL